MPVLVIGSVGLVNVGTFRVLITIDSFLEIHFFVRIVHLWNALPDSIKCISSLNLFKKQLKSYCFTRLKNVFVTDNVVVTR